MPYKGEIYDGQHQAIIDEALWHQVNDLLIKNAVRARKQKNNSSHVAFKGKLFDEYDRPLLPSFNRKKDNERRYYYTSSELVHKSSARCENPNVPYSKWRLPALFFEATIIQILQEWLTTISANTLLMDRVNIEQIEQFEINKAKISIWLLLVKRITLYQDRVTIAIDEIILAQALNMNLEHFNQDALLIKAPFTYRKRGVESKLIIHHQQGIRDQTLLNNIAKAHEFYRQIKLGADYETLVQKYDTNRDRVQKLLPFAFLAPSIINLIEQGKQPLSFTSDWLIRNPLPACWAAQKDIISRMT